MTLSGSEQVVLGRLGDAYGLRGWLRVHFFSDDGQTFGSMPQWWLANSADAPGSHWQSRSLSALKAHGKGSIVKFAGVDDRTAAEALAGCYIAAPRDHLPATARDEYYWVDLLGLDVVNAEGILLGQVAELMNSGAHAVLCVRDAAGQERLLPFVAAVVKSVDRSQRKIAVDWDAAW